MKLTHRNIELFLKKGNISLMLSDDCYFYVKKSFETNKFKFLDAQNQERNNFLLLPNYYKKILAQFVSLSDYTDC